MTLILRQGESGFSVFETTPHKTLQAFIDFYRAGEDNPSANEEQKKRARGYLKQYPDVQTMFDKGWRVAKIPKQLVLDFDLRFSKVEENGHCEITVDADILAVFPVKVDVWVNDGLISLLDDPADYDLTQT